MVKERMKKTERREELLRILREVHGQAPTRAEFTAERVAAAGSVSVARVYQLVGPEFKALRKGGKEARRPPQTEEHRLRQKNAALRGDLKAANTQYDSFIQGDAAEAIRIIEALDEENRMLRGEIKLLKRQLLDAGVIKEPSLDDADFEEPEQNELSSVDQPKDNSDLDEIIEADGRYSN